MVNGQIDLFVRFKLNGSAASAAAPFIDKCFVSFFLSNYSNRFFYGNVGKPIQHRKKIVAES